LYIVPTIPLGQIAAILKCPIPPGKAEIPITGVASLENAGPTQLSFFTAEHYHKQFKATGAGAVLVDKSLRPQAQGKPVVLIVDSAETAMSEVLRLFAPAISRPAVGVDAAARVDSTAQIGDGCAVGALSIVGARSRIGNRSVVHPFVFIGEDVNIGDDCEIFPNVTIRERITIGNRVVIHANSVLGTDGFGYRWDGSKHAKVPQIGTVIIEDDVELGSCVCVDRAKFGVTRVGRGSKVDNLVQIAHNVIIGPHCMIVGQVGLAGSAKLGTGVVMGGQSAVRDHIHMGDGSTAAARAGITEHVPAGATVSGIPALPHRQSLREQAAMRRLPDLIVQVRKLQEEIEALKKK
jgi:UDP-3-O-[3-hydroxymyristoyl] glucosamine N-acyltransferase